MDNASQFVLAIFVLFNFGTLIALPEDDFLAFFDKYGDFVGWSLEKVISKFLGKDSTSNTKFDPFAAN